LHFELLTIAALSFLAPWLLNSSACFGCSIDFIGIGLAIDIAYSESSIAEIRLDLFD